MKTYELRITFDANDLQHAAKIRDVLENVLELVPDCNAETEMGQVD
jgi:hypothetical protein